MALTPEEHNRRVAAIRVQRDRREEEMRKAAGVHDGPFTAGALSKRDKIARECDDWEADEVSQLAAQRVW